MRYKCNWSQDRLRQPPYCLRRNASVIVTAQQKAKIKKVQCHDSP